MRCRSPSACPCPGVPLASVRRICNGILYIAANSASAFAAAGAHCGFAKEPFVLQCADFGWRWRTKRPPTFLPPNGWKGREPRQRPGAGRKQWRHKESRKARVPAPPLPRLTHQNHSESSLPTSCYGNMIPCFCKNGNGFKTI